MDPVSIVAGGVAFATAIKDIISLGLKLRESLQNTKQDMNELQMLSQELLADMYRLQAFYERMSYVDSSQSDHLLYELDAVKRSLERILKKCQNLALGKSASLLPLWPEWNFRRSLENELPRLRRQVKKIRSQFVFHSNIRLEHAALVQSTEQSALLQRSQGAIATLLMNPDSDYSQSIVSEMENDIHTGMCNSIAVQYLKLHITSLWAMAEHPLSNAPFLAARPFWDPHTSDHIYLEYCLSASIQSLSQKVLSLFLELSSRFDRNTRHLLDELTDIARQLAVLGMYPSFPQLMCRVEDTAKQIATRQRGFTVDHAYYIYWVSYFFSTSGNQDAAFTWSEKALQVLDGANATGLWSSENTSHLSASLHLLHGQNCLKSPQWMTHAELHLMEARNISKRLLDSCSLDCSVPSIVHHDWLRATFHLGEYHQMINHSQQALSQILEGLRHFLHMESKDVDDVSTGISEDLNRSVREALNTLKDHDIPLTAIYEMLSLYRDLTRRHPPLFADMFFRLVIYHAFAVYFLAQDPNAPSDTQLRLMRAFVCDTTLDEADDSCLNDQLCRSLVSLWELQGENYVYEILFAYFFSPPTVHDDMDIFARDFFDSLITQLTIRFPSAMEKATVTITQLCADAIPHTMPSPTAITIGIHHMPFEHCTTTTISSLHTLCSLLPRRFKCYIANIFIEIGDVERARALIFDPNTEWPSEGYRSCFEFIWASIVLQPNSLSLALDAVNNLENTFLSSIIEFLALGHHLKESFSVLQQRNAKITKYEKTFHEAIIWCCGGNHYRAQKLLHQAASLSHPMQAFFCLEQYYAALSHYQLLQFNEGLEIMVNITDEVRLSSHINYPCGLRHHGRARLFQIYSALLAGVGRLPEALDAAQEAIRSYRSMVLWGPGYSPFLAQSLETYAQILEQSEASSEMGCSSAQSVLTPTPPSLDVWTEAVDVWRGLAEKEEFFSMGFVDAMDMLRQKLARVGRDKECEKIGKEIQQWKERAEKVKRDKIKDIEELEKAWKEAYPDWTDEIDDEEEFFSADEGDGMDDSQVFLSAEEDEPECAKNQKISGP